ncbi:MAG: protein-glutamate O-methyltransferase CheR [Terracidiphilus sp.]|nr:protein-glutamate O-methyltransferase CheR [Terracidiphilus sp.]
MSARDEYISNRDYARLCELIYAEAGIHLGTEKKTMLEVRIKRRLKVLNLDSYGRYCDYLFGHKGLKDEITHLIDVVTTNKTDFFREPKHFDFLANRALPERTECNDGRQFLIWSAGCSTGEEPYTMAIVLSEYALTHPGFRFRIQASDISTVVLDKAEMGVYTNEIVAPVPLTLRRKYFMRSRDPNCNRVRVVPELRKCIEFRRLNFMDSDYRIPEKADAIFCRNVIIYFDRPTQERILQKLSNCLLPGGYLFVGHSETLHDMNLPLTPVAPALYRRIDGKE